MAYTVFMPLPLHIWNTGMTVFGSINLQTSKGSLIAKFGKEHSVSERAELIELMNFGKWVGTNQFAKAGQAEGYEENTEPRHPVLTTIGHGDRPEKPDCQHWHPGEYERS